MLTSHPQGGVLKAREAGVLKAEAEGWSVLKAREAGVLKAKPEGRSVLPTEGRHP
jgi:hypothetical protein